VQSVEIQVVFFKGFGAGFPIVSSKLESRAFFCEFSKNTTAIGGLSGIKSLRLAS